MAVQKDVLLIVYFIIYLDLTVVTCRKYLLIHAIVAIILAAVKSFACIQYSQYFLQNVLHVHFMLNCCAYAHKFSKSVHYADSQGSKVCKGEILCRVQTFQSGHQCTKDFVFNSHANTPTNLVTSQMPRDISGKECMD